MKRERMSAITLTQPWGWAVCQGKTPENRSWPPTKSLVGSDIAIHAGLKLDKLAFDDVRDALATQYQSHKPHPISEHEWFVRNRELNTLIKEKCFVRGAVVAVVKLAGAVRFPYASTGVVEYQLNGRHGELNRATCQMLYDSPWRSRDPETWLWHLTNVRVLPEPVPCKGFHKLWKLPEDVERAVFDQLKNVDPFIEMKAEFNAAIEKDAKTGVSFGTWKRED